MKVRIKTDVRPVTNGLKGMRRNGRNLRPPLAKNKAEFRREQKANAARKEGPDGRAWAPRKPETEAASIARRRQAATAKGRRRKPRKAEKMLGKLAVAVQYTMTARRGMAALVATSIPSWSGIHQTGGTAGKGARIPARTFLYVTERFLRRKIVPAVLEHVMKGYR